MNPKRYSQIERALNILDKSGTVGILRDDQYLLFFFKKTERIVTALYILTGLMSDNEPLKWEIRDGGAQLIKDVLSFKEHALVNSKEFINEVLVAMARIISLLDIAFIADLVSAMNFNLLKKELESLTEIAEGRGRASSAFTAPTAFEEGFFGIPKDLFSKTTASPHTDETSGGSEDPVSFGSLNEFERFKRAHNMYKGHSGVRDNVLEGGTVSMGRIQPDVSGGTFDKRQVVRVVSGKIREERRQIILEVIKKKGSAIIGDFPAVIRGCSEKTIQRLLLGMVDEGVLKKDGERRWSRYSLLV